MMRFLFAGSVWNNAGPSNVNRSLRTHLDADSFLLIKSLNKYICVAEGFIKLFFCRGIVVASISRKWTLLAKVAKFFGKKIVFIMHGCVAYEEKVNLLLQKENLVQYETTLLEISDLILPVSKKFMLWMQERYPQYSEKIQYLYNGVEHPGFELREEERDAGRIIAVGGNRPTKNNEKLCEAVEGMEENVNLCIYGDISDNVSFPQHIEKTTYRGVVSQPELYEAMSASSLFVLNSIFEPFSLAVIDALNCGCSILVSHVAGVNDLLDLREEDIIYDPMNVDEIRQKIRYLLEHPNCNRILGKLDYEKNSYACAAQKLLAYCRSVAGKK